MVSPYRLKQLLLIALGILAGFQLQGQGTVNLSNRGLNAPVGAPCSTNGITIDGITLAPAGTTLSVALYFAPPDPANPSVQPDPSVFGQVGASAFLVAPGIYDAGTRTADVSPPGGMGWFQVKVWQTAYGNTFESARASGQGEFGLSNVIEIPTGNPLTIPPGLPHALTGISRIYVFGPLEIPPCVPEPSVLVLAFCGAAILLFLASRHRNN
jgi:hypothetical protein